MRILLNLLIFSLLLSCSPKNENAISGITIIGSSNFVNEVKSIYKMNRISLLRYSNLNEIVGFGIPVFYQHFDFGSDYDMIDGFYDSYLAPNTIYIKEEVTNKERIMLHEIIHLKLFHEYPNSDIFMNEQLVEFILYEIYYKR